MTPGGLLRSIAAEFQFSEVFVSAVNQQQLVLANPTRVSLIFGLGNSNQTWVSTVQNGAIGHGIQLFTNQLTVLKVQDVGPLVQAAWYAIIPSLSSNINVWEVTLPNGG